MCQSTTGRHYLVVMPYNQPARVQVWAATDAEGLQYKLAVEKRLNETVAPTYAGLAVSCLRNGSIQDDVIDCLFPSGHSFHYFRIRLKIVRSDTSISIAPRLLCARSFEHVIG